MSLATRIRRVRNVLDTRGVAGIRGALLSRVALRPSLLAEPYDYVQADVVHRLAAYLRVPPDRVGLVIMVGAHLGHEVRTLARAYPRCRFVLFEASRRYADALEARFAGEPRVRVEKVAVADAPGEIEFHETSLEGSGSIQALGELAKRSFGATEAERFTVPAVTLDGYLEGSEHAGAPIDCLWIDVQGAELRVLDGASEALGRARSAFVEVSLHEPLYEGGALYADIAERLAGEGLVLAGAGTDPGNGTGNAFFLRSPVDGA